MAFIVSYQKFINAQITRTLRLPEDPASRAALGTELATIDGVTYVCLPDGAAVPGNQPTEIAASIQAVTLNETLRDAIAAASPHYKLINTRVGEHIRSRYSTGDEMQCLRLAPSEQTSAWNAWVEECCDWGRREKALLGLQ